jgi:ABC-2 type transport system ATP-binding protein
MEHTADQLIVIGKGRLIAAESVTEFAARGSGLSVSVRTTGTGALTALLAGAGGTVQPAGGDLLTVTGLTADKISELAFGHRIQLRELTTHAASLEDAFMRLTATSVEYQSGERR